MLISVREYANNRGVEKSKVLYYINKKLIPVKKVIGKAFMLREDECNELFDKIDLLQAQGRTLSEIKLKLNADKKRAKQNI